MFVCLFILLNLQRRFSFFSLIQTLDTDECTVGTYPCDPNATCRNTKGSFECNCKDGFTGDGKRCRGKKDHSFLSMIIITY